MDDISRELPPDDTGAAPVSERQKGPEELVRFERGHVGEGADGGPESDALVLGDRLAGMGAQFLADRIEAAAGEADGDVGDDSDVAPTRIALQVGAVREPGEDPGDDKLADDKLADDKLADDKLAGDQLADGSPADGSSEADASVADAADAQAAEAEAPEAVAPEAVAPEAVAPDAEASEAEASEAEAPEAEAPDVDAAEVGSSADEAADDTAPDGTAASDGDSGDDAAGDGIVGDPEPGEEHTSTELDADEPSAADLPGSEELDPFDPASGELGEDGLPVVPELENVDEVAKVVFVLMLTSRDGMTVLRLAQACNTSQKLVEQALEQLQQDLRDRGMPVELARVGDSVRWMSSSDVFPYLERLRGVKKQEKLSPAALETLAVVAYQQPVMRSEIEAIRGVKAGPMLRTLLQHKLVKVTGRADVPGRPLQYGTTQQFLERFGLASIDELPSVKEWKNLG